jgi:hypothetical protein
MYREKMRQSTYVRTRLVVSCIVSCRSISPMESREKWVERMDDELREEGG